ncbi:hypothetical protein FIBSPDRAFT_1047489 [Athelia psychrophila]|uniref:Smr domain-containing protein n=1 Tax=Athelia psychrophila TaxID=1759441 RepID=A0A166F9D1_9AGAM|nr:hypothetical protein FIBSPDRAFT_1047489 [Fibularhizoctonia sp. CBS 109695]
MDSLYAIGLGLGLRVIVDILSQGNLKIGGTVVGLWEGVVLYHFMGKMPRSSDPYIAYGFRLFVDLVVTESLAKTGIVMLWTGLGVLLSDVGPVAWKDLEMRRTYKRYLVQLPSVPKVGIPSQRVVQFWDSPTPSSAVSEVASEVASDFTVDSPTTVLPIPPPRSRAVQRPITPPTSPRPPYPLPRTTKSRPSPPPGALPGIWSETESIISASGLTSPSASDSGTATPVMTYIPEIADEDNTSEIQNAAGIVSVLMDADGVTVTADAATNASGELTPTRNSVSGRGSTRDSTFEGTRNSTLEDTRNSTLESTRNSTLESTHDSLGFPTTHAFEVVEREEAQPDFESLASIPDAEASTVSLLLPIAAPSAESTFSPIPPHPVPAVPIFNFTPPVFIEHELPPIPEDEASIPLPPSDGMTFPPPSDEWDRDRLSVTSFPNRNSFSSEITLPETVLAGTRDSLINHADLLREKAEEEDKIRSHLVNDRKRLEAMGDVKGAFLLRADIEEAEARAKKFHDQAERRYFTGYNKDATPMVIDVHKLKVPEAIRRTEKAIRDLLLLGGTELRVITAGKIVKGTHLAIIGAMQEHRIFSVEDPFKPGVVVITLPTS